MNEKKSYEDDLLDPVKVLNFWDLTNILTRPYV